MEELDWGNYTLDKEETEQDEDNDEQDIVNARVCDPSSSTTIAWEGRQRRPHSYLQDYLTRDDLQSDDEELNVMEVQDQDPIKYEEAIKYDKLVARGYGQEYGIDYVEVYSPVARMDTIRMMIAIGAQRGWNIHQMYVKYAFLHGMLEEDVYVQQPQGYVVKNEEHEVYKLRKALYGLKQTPKAWFTRIESYFVKDGFNMSKSEHTLFIKEGPEGNLLFVNIYVDDLICTGSDEKMLSDLKLSMKKEFEMTDMGKMRYFLGIEVVQTMARIHISQRKYASEILERFNMVECNGVINPIVPGTKGDSVLAKHVGLWNMVQEMRHEGNEELLYLGPQKKQSVVALSSTEAEYVATAACACQVIWSRGILEELGVKLEEGTVIKSDNTSAIKLAKNPVFHGRCKHVRFHFLRDIVNEGTIKLDLCGTRYSLSLCTRMCF
ncbi:hypothetical protein L1987_47542 [Smallanthus sonchifolius]|uniref:Uncharacterized protein n=1 Tax=Smallanthus sonchifolius TaxID=185202 RepID=A0ACB9G3T4_9ASTR|nr:hypothetical protein L1987_47542 [Smallanthus sonchifolius]